MEIVSFIKKNKFFTIISILFVIWSIFLIILCITGQRTVIFYDALGQADVSSDFSSNLSLSRYSVEPFYAIGYVLEYEFTWMYLFLIFYPILRGIYLFLKKKGMFNSEKYKYLTQPLSDIIYFSFKVLALSVFIVAVYILIGYILLGEFFVGRYFMVPIQLVVHLGMILIIIKVIYILLKLFHPKLALNLSKKKLKNERKKRKMIQTFKREFVYYVGIGVLLISTNIILISTPFPPHEIVLSVPLEADEFLFDFHVHTTFSDGWMTPEERVQWYIKQGISGAVFSDHDNIRGAKAAQEYVRKYDLEFIVFMGEEWTDNVKDIHMNYFGIAEEIIPIQCSVPGGPKAMNVSDIINYVKSNGGYITVNHYNYDPNPEGGFGVPHTLDQLKDWGVDGFEIINGGSYGGKYQQIRDYCINNNLTCIGGSDIHTNEDLNTFIKVKLADPTNLTIANIFETLKRNEHEVIGINLNPEVVDFSDDVEEFGFYVVSDYINYLLNIDIYQALSWIIWSGLTYLIFFISYRKIKRVDVNYLKRKIF